MWRARSIFLLALLFPLASTAASQGFAPASLWLSTNDATAGQVLKVYSVLYNSSAEAFEGDIDFAADSESIQTLHFKLSPGETRIISADWTAIAGEHSFSAQLKNLSAEAISGSLITNTVRITVASSSPSITQTYLNAANEFLASASPGLASFASSVASTTENWRSEGAEWLSKELYTDQATTASGTATSTSVPHSAVLGATTYRDPGTTGSSSMWETIKHGVLTALLFIFNIQIAFYLTLLAVIYVLYKVVQAMFRSRRRGAE